MKLWFITDTPRLAKERVAVERLVAEAGWFSLQRWSLFEGRFCAEGVIRAHETDYAVRLVYPDQFPEVPAWIEPQDAKAQWSSHQYGKGGTLCLELRPDTWEEAAAHDPLGLKTTFDATQRGKSGGLSVARGAGRRVPPSASGHRRWISPPVTS